MLLSASKHVENKVLSGRLDTEIIAYNIRTKDRINNQCLINSNDSNNIAGFISGDEIDLIP